MVYIVSAECMAYVEISELVERAKEEGNQVEIFDNHLTSTLAIESLQQIMTRLNAEPEHTRIISNGAAEFVAAIILGADFTWALDIY